jgi:branched-chain amino acid transport system substrate-binding protein
MDSAKTFPLLLSMLAIIWVAMGCESSKPVYRCTDAVGCVDLSPEEPIRIGVIQALSGKVAPLGVEQVRGFELALDRRERKVLGHSIVFQVEDTGCTPEGGANAALKVLADPKTAAILGTTCSAAAATVSKAMSDAGLTMVSGNNSAPYLTTIGGKAGPQFHPGYFRTASNEEHSGKAAAVYAFEHLMVRKAATIDDGDIYTRGLTQGFSTRFQELGGQIVLSASIDKGDKDMKPVLTAVKNAGPQLLFFPLFQPEANLILKEARKMSGLEDLVLMSDGAVIENSFIQDVQQAGKGMYFVGPTAPSGPKVDTLANAYLRKFQAEPATAYYLSAYDAADLLFEAIEKTAIREKDGTLHIGRQALRDTLYRIREYPGVSGTLSCDEFGDCALAAFDILKLEDPSAGVTGLQRNVMFTYTGKGK